MFQVSKACPVVTTFSVTVVAILLCGLLGSGVAWSDPAPHSQAPCHGDVMLVLDGSGSMGATDFPDGAPSRMDRMRVALSNVIPGVEKTRRIGLVVYAQGVHENSCQNVELKFPPRPNAAKAIFTAAERMRPGGRTPLAYSVSLARSALKDHPRPSEIVVLTDGEDTCGGDPCALARSIKATDAGITVHVIGFRLPSSSETQGARCLADVTGGKFVTAESTDELSDALRQTLSCPEVARSNGDGLSRNVVFETGRGGALIPVLQSAPISTGR